VTTHLAKAKHPEKHMAQATFYFPRNFYWGTATSSHQVEGHNTNNNWWAWEQQAGRIVNGHKSGLACDWWGGRWKEDFDRAAETGQNAHRFSIEWSRIQPAPDRWDEAALERYREMLRGLHERSMTPMVTLHHFSDPIWLAERGGWENKEVIHLFEIYVRKAVEALHEYCSLWITINEPNVYAFLGYLLGLFPPGKKDLLSTMRVLENMMFAHAAAYRAIHDLQPEAKVGIAHNYRPFKPARTWSPLDRSMASIQNQYFNNLFPLACRDGKLYSPILHRRLPEIQGTQDFFGLNYYTSEMVAFNLLNRKTLFSRNFFSQHADLSDNGMIANEPSGKFQALTWSRQFNLPIIITENGVEDADDHLRPRYLLQHLHQVWRAVNFNWPVVGYFHWSLVDNFEWERGWTQRFGLWELDLETQARRKRPSADLYAAICRENGISSEMVSQYAPEVLEKLFPG
jgi:beta-glucosidase